MRTDDDVEDGRDMGQGIETGLGVLEVSEAEQRIEQEVDPREKDVLLQKQHEAKEHSWLEVTVEVLWESLEGRHCQKTLDELVKWNY